MHETDIIYNDKQSPFTNLMEYIVNVGLIWK